MIRLLTFLATFCAVICHVEAQTNFTIAVIPKGTTHEFWKSIHAGAVKAQQELKEKGTSVDLIWKGPLREDDRDQQISVVQNFTTRKVSGIVLAPLDSQALARYVDSAVQAKVPVVVIDSGLKSDKYSSFIATDNYKGGEMAGKWLGTALGGKGKVIMLPYAVGSASTEDREAGFLHEIKTDYPAIQILSSNQYAGPTRDTAFQVAQSVLNRFGREVDGFFAPNEPITAGVILALRNIGKAGGKVKVVGFDAGVQCVEGLKKGDVQALILQNPIKMGYLGVMTLVDKLQGREVPKRIDTGVEIVTSENMNAPEMQDLLNPPWAKYVKE